MRRAVWMAAVVLGVSANAAAAQPPSVRATLSGRSHFQWSTTSVEGDGVVGSTFETRRVRLSADVAVGDWITGRIEPEFTMGQLRLRQAWMAFELDEALLIRAGQVKKPFSLINLTSSSQLPVIERGLRIRGVSSAGEAYTLLEEQAHLGYDQGVMVEGSAGALGWAAGVFNGTGPDRRDDNDGKSLAARATFAVPTSSRLAVGAAVSRREVLLTPGGSRSGTAFSVDAELGGFRRGVWVLGEAAVGTHLVTEERFAAAQLVASLFRATGSERVEGVEPVARISWADPDDAVDGDAGMLLTPGVNLYFAGRNRFMLNWDVYIPEADGVDTQHALRAQFNLHF